MLTAVDARTITFTTQEAIAEHVKDALKLIEENAKEGRRELLAGIPHKEQIPGVVKGLTQQGFNAYALNNCQIKVTW